MKHPNNRTPTIKKGRRPKSGNLSETDLLFCKDLDPSLLTGFNAKQLQQIHDYTATHPTDKPIKF